MQTKASSTVPMSAVRRSPFSPDGIAITAEQNVLTVEGRKAEKGQREFLYQGISARPFKRQFNLADYVQVRTHRT